MVKSENLVFEKQLEKKQTTATHGCFVFILFILFFFNELEPNAYRKKYGSERH